MNVHFDEEKKNECPLIYKLGGHYYHF